MGVGWIINQVSEYVSGSTNQKLATSEWASSFFLSFIPPFPQFYTCRMLSLPNFTFKLMMVTAIEKTSI